MRQQVSLTVVASKAAFQCWPWPLIATTGERSNSNKPWIISAVCISYHSYHKKTLPGTVGNVSITLTAKTTLKLKVIVAKYFSSFLLFLWVILLYWRPVSDWKESMAELTPWICHCLSIFYNRIDQCCQSRLCDKISNLNSVNNITTQKKNVIF